MNLNPYPGPCSPSTLLIQCPNSFSAISGSLSVSGTNTVTRTGPGGFTSTATCTVAGNSAYTGSVVPVPYPSSPPALGTFYFGRDNCCGVCGGQTSNIPPGTGSGTASYNYSDSESGSDSSFAMGAPVIDVVVVLGGSGIGGTSPTLWNMLIDYDASSLSTRGCTSPYGGSITLNDLSLEQLIGDHSFTKMDVFSPWIIYKIDVKISS
jgi:hypothetical protein